MKNDRLQAVLRDMNAEFDRSALDWLISMYDAKSGGFYYAVSSRDNAEFEPDIESTTQAINVIEFLSAVEYGDDGFLDLPENFKCGIIDFLSSRQDESDGYFYDPIYKEIGKKDKKERNTSFATACLKKLGAKPLYPTPMERSAKSDALKSTSKDNAMYENKESFLAWLDENAIARNNNSYVWGSDLSSAGSMIRANGHYKTAVEWLRARQYADNGTWEPEFNLNAVNGVLKISNYFNKDEEYPNYEIYVKNLVKFMKHDFDPTTSAATWNPIASLNRVLGGLPNKPTEEIQAIIDEGKIEIIENTLKRMRQFRQPDGGYGYKKSGSSSISNGVRVALGLPEGDMNSLALMTYIFKDAYTLAGVEKPKLWKDYHEYFTEEIAKKRANEK